jgi:hypothetical protein
VGTGLSSSINSSSTLTRGEVSLTSANNYSTMLFCPRTFIFLA